MYIACTTDGQVRRVGDALTGFSGGANLFQFPTPDGQKLDVFDGRGRHLQTTDALTGTVLLQFGYDSAGRLASVTDSDGNVTQIKHDSSGNPTKIIAPFGQESVLAVDGNGYLSKVTDPANNVTTFSYDANGLMSTKVDPNLGLSQYLFDPRGRLQVDEDAVGSSKTVTRTSSASQTGFTVSTTTMLGRPTSYQTLLNSDGSFSRTNTGPDQLQSTLKFTPRGVTTTTAPDGTQTTSRLIPDPRFGVVSPTQSLTTTLPSLNVRTQTMSRSATFSGTSLASLTETTDLNGNVWSRTFDVRLRTWTSTSPLGRHSTLAVDSAGRPTSSSIPRVLTRETRLDSEGRKSVISQGVRNRVFSYFNTDDARNGYLQTETDALSQMTTYGRDALGRETSQTAPDSSVTSLSWDGLGNLKSVTPPDHPAHAMSYTGVNLLSQYTPPLLASLINAQTMYEYDADRNLKKVTRPDGLILDYAYDATSGRLSTITTAAGTVAHTYTKGQLTKLVASAEGVTVDYAYDGPLVVRQEWSGSVVGKVETSYNNDFRPISESIAGAGTVHFGYDNDGLLTCASPSSCSPASTDSLSLTYDSNYGRLIASQLGTVSTALTYNEFGEPAAETAASGTTALYSEIQDSVAHPRDALGRTLFKTETLLGSTINFGYTYDNRGRLRRVTQGGTQTALYDYDSNGNRLSVTAPAGVTNGTYDAQDRLLTYGTFTYTYTANGELQTKTDSSSGQVTTYHYDVFGNLKRVDLPAGDLIEYLVDGQNRRVAKKKNGAFVKKWLYRDGLHPVEELDGAGNVLKRFLYASGKNSPDLMIQAGVPYRILSDHLGSPRLVANASTGAVAQRMRHDEFGNVLEDTNVGFTPFGFAGGLYDADTGLVRFGVRDYDPVVGRWISKDPIRFDGGQPNLYVYVGNDPVNRLDTTGKYDDKACTQCLQGAADAFQRCRANCVSDHITDAPICSTPGAGTQSDNAYQRCLQGCVDAGQGAEQACLNGPSCN